MICRQPNTFICPTDHQQARAGPTGRETCRFFAAAQGRPNSAGSNLVGYFGIADQRGGRIARAFCATRPRPEVEVHLKAKNLMASGESVACCILIDAGLTQIDAP
jgi:hypothetical protein